MGKRGEINGLRDGLNNFWSILFMYFFLDAQAHIPTLVLNYTIITLHQLTASASRSVPGEN